MENNNNNNGQPKATKAKANKAKPVRNDAKGKVPEIVLARNALVAGIAKAERATSGLYERFANALNKMLGKGWPDLSFGGRELTAREKVLRDQRRTQKVTFIEACQKRGIRNPYSAWKNVEDWARGTTATQQKAKRGAHANAARDADTRYVEECSKLYKFGLNCEEMSEKALAMNVRIGEGLRDVYGVDLSTLVK